MEADAILIADSDNTMSGVESARRHQQLKDAVVEAALADRANENTTFDTNEAEIDAMIRSRAAFRKAVDELMEFEAKTK